MRALQHWTFIVTFASVTDNSLLVFMKLYNNHKITIVTVCYNVVNDIEKTILSVINQTYSNIEYIVIDGGSTDGTVDIIRKYADRIDQWVSEPDGGIYDAMNKGVRLATGEYVNFMNAGDTFFDNDVLRQIFEGKNYNEDILYGYHILHFKGGYKPHYPSNPNILNQGMMPFCHQSMFTRTQLLREHPYDTSYKILADYMFAKNLLNSGGTFREIKKFVAVFNVNGISASVSMSAYYEMCRAYGWKPSLRHFLKLYRKALWRPIRYCSIKIFVKSLWRPDKYSTKLRNFKQFSD